MASEVGSIGVMRGLCHAVPLGVEVNGASAATATDDD